MVSILEVLFFSFNLSACVLMFVPCRQKYIHFNLEADILLHFMTYVNKLHIRV